MKTLMMAEKTHARCLTLKSRVNKLDDLFYEYVKRDKFEAEYCNRVIAAKEKLRNEMGLYLGIIL